jgi:ubiquinone/menaquinone biosynthesis C-methylase UbiE
MTAPTSPHPLLSRILFAPLVLLLLLGCAPQPAADQAIVPPVADTAVQAAPAPAAPARKPANVMSHEGAAWLEREGREEAERPDIVMAAMDLRPGLTVAEIGAGTGWYTRRIAPAVAPGKVYAVDIQPEMLELLKTKYSPGIPNIVTVLGTDTDPRLPAGSVDRMLMVDVYHEFQKPREMLASLRKTLAPGGTVTVVEYRLEVETASHIYVDHRMSVEQVLAEWTPAGFELVERIETLPSQHLFVFRAR